MAELSTNIIIPFKFNEDTTIDGLWVLRQFRRIGAVIVGGKGEARRNSW